MLHKLKITSYALIILLILVLPSQADEYCTTADMCAAAAQAAGKKLGNKRGNSGYPFVLGTNTYGCWYYPDSHANKNYAGSAFWGAASSEAQMRDPDPGAAHHVRLKCEGGGPAQTIMEAAPVIAAPEAQVAAPGIPIYADGFCTTEDACAAAAQSAGLTLGGAGHSFVLPNTTSAKGCWYYVWQGGGTRGSDYEGNAYFGPGGTEAEMELPVDPNKRRLKCGPAAEEEQRQLTVKYGHLIVENNCKKEAKIACKGQKMGYETWPKICEDGKISVCKCSSEEFICDAYGNVRPK